MRGNLLFILIVFLVLLGIDIYIFQGIRALMQDSAPVIKRLVYSLYWAFSVFLFTGIFLYAFVNGDSWARSTKSMFMGVQVLNLMPKLFFLVFMLLDDLQRGARWAVQKLTIVSANTPVVTAEEISRSDFLLKSGIVLATIPLVSVSYGLISGAHDYRVKRVKLPLKNLPASFHGLKIAQISDIHSGSFFNKKAVLGGVEMLINEKPDVAFFTGDLVNEVAKEVKDYIDIFSKVKAPLGVFSTLGNHDYGEYVRWPSAAAKARNLEDLMQAHKLMGWNLLNNENRILEESGEKLAVIGVENWGAGERWPKYGKLDKAVQGTDEASVKLLLSHDPSHWDAQVRPGFSDIDVMFAGHTHGCQFGIEIGNIKWSPAKYFYKQWGGLYQEGDQFLYVNRGYGFIGFPGRVGMPPEITIFELIKA